VIDYFIFLDVCCLVASETKKTELALANKALSVLAGLNNKGSRGTYVATNLNFDSSYNIM